MAFGNAMKMMKGPAKPKAKAPDAVKGIEKPTPKGKIEGEHGDGPGDAKSGMAIDKDGEGYKTSDGQSHGHLGAALMHVANHHEPGGKHMHHHSDGFGVRSHGVDESGQHHGPVEHESPEEAGSHAASFLADQGVGGGDEEVGNQPAHTLGGF